MKRTLIVLFAIALFQAASAFAQDGGDRKQGRSRDDGGMGNSNSSGGERLRNSGDNSERPQSNNQLPKAQKQRKGGNKQRQPGFSKKNGLSNNNRGTNGASNLAGGRSLNNTTQGVNSQNRSFNGNRKNAGGNGFQGAGNNHSQTSSFPSKFQKMGIKSAPQPIRNRSQILTTNRQHSVMTPPQSGPKGQVLHASVFAPRAMTGRVVQNHMTSIAASTTFRAQINVYNTSENRANNYYWHNYNGVNYCHYYDNWGYHWYGWYLGSNCFWTRYYSNNWWWYDSGYDRWCYWHDGGWWWQDPARVSVVYVYNDGNYSPINSTPSYNNNDSNQVVYQSNDGTRKIKLMGDGRDAFLYDTSNSPSFDPVYLGSGIKDVKFSDTTNGKPLQVILTLNDGSFQMFDESGNRYNGGSNE